MDDFRHVIPMSVRFADLDALGHLNNAKYLTYIEQARIEYVRDVCGWSGDWQTLGMILAQAVLNFRLPVVYGDVVRIYTRCSRLGGKSFDLTQVIVRERSAAEEVVATATTVMVAFDYALQQSIPVPAEWRERIIAYEPLAPAT